LCVAYKVYSIAPKILLGIHLQALRGIVTISVTGTQRDCYTFSYKFIFLYFKTSNTLYILII